MPSLVANSGKYFRNPFILGLLRIKKSWIGPRNPRHPHTMNQDKPERKIAYGSMAGRYDST